MPSSTNHARNVFKKTEQVNGLDVLIYFWDERDGPTFSGWWFGPKVGGDQVWAYNPENSTVPPQSGWRVPYDGPIDASFTVAQSTGGQSYDSYQSGQQQGWGQQQQQYGQQQGAWGQQDTYGQQAQQSQQPFDVQAYYRRQEEEQRREQEQKEQQRQQEAMRQQQAEQERYRQQQLELQRQQQEYEARKKQQEELIRKRAEEEQQRLEQHYTMVARRAIQRIRLATPETYDAMEREVEVVLAQELPKCGSQAPQVREEATKAIEQMRQRMEDIKLQRQKEEEKRLQEEQLRKDQEEKAKQLLVQLGELIDKAEKDIEKVKEARAPLGEIGSEKKDLEASELASAEKSVREVAVDAKASCKACTDFLVEQRPIIEQARFLLAETRQELVKVQMRLHVALKFLTSTLITAKAMHTKAAKKVAAAKHAAKIQDIFEKYDRDGDGLLSRQDIVAYAKGEFKFDMSDEAVEKSWCFLVTNGDAGIPLEKFQRLKVSVGIAREEAASEIRLRILEEKRKHFEARKKELQDKIDKVTESANEVEPEVAKAEGMVAPFKKPEFTAGAPAEVKEMIDKSRDQIEAARQEIETVRKDVGGLTNDVDQDMLDFVNEAVARLTFRLNMFGSRLDRAASELEQGQEMVNRQEVAIVAQDRSKVSKVVWDHLSSAKLSSDDLFKSLTKDDGGLRKDAFLAFFELCKSDISKESLEMLHKHLDEEGKGELSKEVFLRLSKLHFRVMQDCVVTDRRAVKDGKIVRRLEVDEVLQVLEGPVQDDAVSLMRLRGRAMKDGIEGWVTVKGNSGTVFLEPGGGVWKTKHEVAVHSTFEPDAEDCKTVHTLKEGSFVEVLEWDKKHEASGSIRVMVKAYGTNFSGWVTKGGDDGKSHFQLL